MHETIRVLLLGTGQMGSGIARVILEKQGLQLVAAHGRRKARAGMDLGQAIGLDRNLDIHISDEIPTVITQTKPHVAIQATCSTLEDALPEITTLVDSGVNVISIAEEMTYPAAKSPTQAKELHQLAVERCISVLGTGVNPGFVLDLLLITLTGVCSNIQLISATRVNDLSPFGPSVLTSQGVGLSSEEFRKGVKEGTVVGHIGFEESMHMIAATLGWTIDRIEQSRQPIVSQVKRETPFVIVEPGQVAGCLHTATAYRQDKPLIELIHPQQIHPQLEGVETGDTIEIKGTPDVRLAGSPEIPGSEGTAALAVNMIPRIINAAPGLYTMADLPVPAAMLNDARRFIYRD